ncbi:LOW QUALITY PROTEIN: coiled-coil domain-containing protein 158-like [Hemibagrus wyckioides]|uniref:LOW QUALITY PROTEIN: coiled-coil domain-containing protein 158-like n=1 Tax=Hemibagrus wyckioides TaxID=337641 RepID=UPI00266D6E3E|nr:LOW QUALITY PROTEIN: coiled-coil domain-containing protein 158-like [Hemibagrus wyckioides]
MEVKHSISLAMLSEELKRRTQETLKLQEEVEQATKLTLEKMGRTFSSTDMPGNHISTNHESEGSPDFRVNTQHSYISPINSTDVDVNVASFQGRDVLKHALEDYSQQVSDLQKQLRETYELHELQKFNFRQSIIQLENKLQGSQTEKDILINLKLKESEKNTKLMEQLQASELELHLLKQAEGHKLMEADDKVKTLNRRAELMTQMLQDIFTRLSDYEKRSGKCSSLCYDGVFSPSQLHLGPAVEKALLDLENDNRGLQEKLQMAQRQLKDLQEQSQEKTECLLQEHKKRVEQLITSHEQKVAMLTEKLESSQTNTDGLEHQVEILKLQLQSQTSLHQSEMSDMKSELSLLRSDLLEKQKSYTAKVSVLEEALAHAKSLAEQVQKERDLLLQQAEDQDTQLCRLTTELRQTAEELCQERQRRHKLEQCGLGVQQLDNLVRSLREQCQAHEDIEEQSSGVGRRLQSLDQWDAELPLKQQEMQHDCTQLEEAHTQVQALQTELELLKVRLEDGKNSGELLMRPLVALQQERNSLTMQLEQLRLDNQQLRAALLEAELRLSALEQEKTQQRAALSERASSLHQLTLEKQQMTSELESQRKKLEQIKEEHEALREEHSRKTEELQWQNSKLKAQRNTIRNDLEKAKSTLKALEGADEHGLKVALGIQKQITAKREQVDLLQSRVQMLEESTEKLTQEKNHQVMKSKRQAQMVLFERERRKRLETELEVCRSKENLLKSEIERLDTALHKMSDSFVECQEYIQKQQQEIMRLKLQHTLELKEGQNLRSTSARTCEHGQDLLPTNNICTSPITSPSISAQVSFQAHSASQVELNISSRKCSPVLELQSLVKELRSVIDMEQSPDTFYTSLRRSRKDEVTRRVEGENRKTSTSISDREQDPVRVPNFNKQDMNGDFSANNKAGMRVCRPQHNSFTALGRRSPVHSLLTSDLPNNIFNSLRTQSPSLTAQTSFIKQAEIAGQTCKKQQSKLTSLQNKAEDHQIKNQEKTSMIKSQEKMRRRIKERKTHKNDKSLDKTEDRRINLQCK